MGSDALSGPLMFNTTPTTLFQFTVEIDNTAVPGDYTAAFVNNLLFDLGDSASTVIPDSQINSTDTALIRLQSVPEPGSLALLSVIGLGAASRFPTP